MKRITPLWIFVLIFTLALIYLPSLSKYLKLKRKETDLQHEVERLRTQVTRLHREEELLKTDLVRLEEVIRQELGLVKPGEIVLKVVEEEVPKKTSEETKTAIR